MNTEILKTGIQAEQVLEDNLIKQLIMLGYSFVKINDEHDPLANLKNQLEKHNKVKLSDNEFAQVLNKLSSGSVFERGKILRNKVLHKKDNDDAGYLELTAQNTSKTIKIF